MSSNSAPAGGIPLRELASMVDGEIEGDSETRIHGVCPLDEPNPGCLSFVTAAELSRLRHLSESALAALMVPRKIRSRVKAPNSLPLLLVEDPLRALVQMIPRLHEPPVPAPGIHSTAVIAESARVGRGVSIGAYCVVGENVQIGDDAVLHPHVVLYQGAEIGARAVLHSGVTVREFCAVGSDGTIQNGAVIGADGFGYIPDKDLGMRPVPQIGRTVIGARVDIGANSCVDRATLGSTSVGDGSKLDNFVQVGHNTKIGKHVVICGQVAIAGSCEIGDRVVLGGMSGVADHVRIGSGSRLAGKGGAINDIPENVDYAGFPAIPASEWRRQGVVIRQLARRGGGSTKSSRRSKTKR